MPGLSEQSEPVDFIIAGGGSWFEISLFIPLSHLVALWGLSCSLLLLITPRLRSPDEILGGSRSKIPRSYNWICAEVLGKRSDSGNSLRVGGGRQWRFISMVIALVWVAGICRAEFVQRNLWNLMPWELELFTRRQRIMLERRRAKQNWQNIR